MSAKTRCNILQTLSIHTLICTTLVLAAQLSLANGALPSAKNAAIRIASPQPGALLTSPIKITLEAERMVIMPAGVPHTDSGHFHLIINSKAPSKADKNVIKEQHKALDKGEREISLALPPGVHTLQAVLVDHLHRPHEPMLQSEPVEITVVAPLVSPKN